MPTPNIYTYIHYTAKSILGHPLLMKGLTTLLISMSTNLNIYAYNDILCGSVVEHCVSSAKGCGFDSQTTDFILMKMYNLNAIVSCFR